MVRPALLPLPVASLTAAAVALVFLGCGHGADTGAGGHAGGTRSPDAGGGADGGGKTDGGVPLSNIDPRPFGHHPACTGAGPGDPYAAATEAKLAWTRGADAPYLFWALIDPERTGDPAKMVFSGSAVGPTGQPIPFDYDKGIGDALASGLAVMWNIAVEPKDLGYRKSNSFLPVDEAAYASFVRTVVSRYPAVRVFQVENEPNMEKTRTDYAAHYALTHKAIKEADPSAVVVMGGVAGNYTTMDWKSTWFDAVLDAVGDARPDVFDFHFYGDPKGGTMAVGGGHFLGYGDIEEVAKFYRERLDSRGLTATRLWTTENGTASGTWKSGPQTFTATEAEQARDLPKRTIVSLASGTDKLFWAWGMTEGFKAWDDDFFDHTGLIYDGHAGPAGTRKLAYWALWQMTRQLAECDFGSMAKIDTTVAQTRAYGCTRKGGGRILAAWWDTFDVAGWADGQTVELTLPWESATAIQRAAVPTAQKGADVADPSTAFATTTLAPAGGGVKVVLGADPVYVRAD